MSDSNQSTGAQLAELPKEAAHGIAHGAKKVAEVSNDLAHTAADGVKHGAHVTAETAKEVAKGCTNNNTVKKDS